MSFEHGKDLLFVYYYDDYNFSAQRKIPWLPIINATDENEHQLTMDYLAEVVDPMERDIPITDLQHHCLLLASQPGIPLARHRDRAIVL
ncbi:unnamed protein product [Strongylus vulgaris]|uniref:Uncharacterized protein n=1 Tax=Strongylus vulgaris TaxID=40348 RepID=A0A3P7J155_STRVU|nr:unnamed protein product [Strongylus vulgaris]